MKVKELLDKLTFENPDSEVISGNDDGHALSIAIVPPQESLGDSVLDDQEAVAVLGSHSKRIERIRFAIASYYGLPVTFKLHHGRPDSGDDFEFRVKSPTGKTVVKVMLRIGYVVRNDECGVRREQMHQAPARGSMSGPPHFPDIAAELAGYWCDIPNHTIGADKLQDAVKSLCESPKWHEVEVDS
jgi:hypothetical protein